MSHPGAASPPHLTGHMVPGLYPHDCHCFPTLTLPRVTQQGQKKEEQLLEVGETKQYLSSCCSKSILAGKLCMLAGFRARTGARAVLSEDAGEVQEEVQCRLPQLRAGRAQPQTGYNQLAFWTQPMDHSLPTPELESYGTSAVLA